MITIYSIIILLLLSISTLFYLKLTADAVISLSNFITLYVVWFMTILLIISIINFSNSILSSRWKKTVGIITKVKIEEGKMKSLNILYTYSINSIDYNSRNINFGSNSFFTSDSIQEYIRANNFAVGNKFTVYYNPNNPKSSTLIKGINYRILINIIFFVPFPCGVIFKRKKFLESLRKKA